MSMLVYTQRSSLLHRLHPFSKTIWILSIGLILSVYFDPVPLAVLLVISLPFFVLGQIPWRRWLKPLCMMWLMGMVSAFIMSIFLNRPGVFTRNLQLMDITLWKIAGEGFFLGPMGVSVGGLIYTLGQTLKSITMLLMVAVFVYSTPPNDLVYLLSKGRLPQKLAFVVMVAYRFFPHLFHKLSIVTAAQRLRGWELTFRNPARMARQFLPIIIPVMTEIVRLADCTTWAVESRAFGTGRFSHYREITMTAVNWLFSGLWVTVMIVFLWLNIRYGIGRL